MLLQKKPVFPGQINGGSIACYGNAGHEAETCHGCEPVHQRQTFAHSFTPMGTNHPIMWPQHNAYNHAYTTAQDLLILFRHKNWEECDVSDFLHCERSLVIVFISENADRWDSQQSLVYADA